MALWRRAAFEALRGRTLSLEQYRRLWAPR